MLCTVSRDAACSLVESLAASNVMIMMFILDAMMILATRGAAGAPLRAFTHNACDRSASWIGQRVVGASALPCRLAAGGGGS